LEKSLLDHIHYFRIPIIDLKASIEWYTTCLRLNLRFSNDELAVLELTSGPLLVLVAADKESRGHFTINGHLEFSIGFTTSKIAEMHQQLIEQGVHVESILEDNGHDYFFFYDPSGNKLQVHN
jgi:catechol 2,3-dioxygenase-like lactoylglutathione lyase family enzyme